MRHANTVSAIACAGVLAVAVAGCGGGGGLLSSGQANTLDSQIQRVSSDLAAKRCSAAAGDINTFKNSVSDLSVNSTLVSNLNQGASLLSGLASKECPVKTKPVKPVKTVKTVTTVTTKPPVTTKTHTVPTHPVTTASRTTTTVTKTTPPVTTTTHTSPPTTTTTTTNNGGSGLGGSSGQSQSEPPDARGLRGQAEAPADNDGRIRLGARVSR